MNVCLYVCMCDCVCACVCACVHICVCVRTYVHVCLHVCALHICSSGSVDSMYVIREQCYSQYSLMCIRGARCHASVSIDSPIVLFNCQLRAILASSKLITSPAGFVEFCFPSIGTCISHFCFRNVLRPVKIKACTCMRKPLG